MEDGRGTSIPWMEEPFPVESTSIPEISGESTKILTIVIFVLSAIVSITLLFVVAVFIDCRQQKLETLEKPKRRKKLIKLKLPAIVIRPQTEDEQSFADKMQEEPSSSNVIV